MRTSKFFCSFLFTLAGFIALANVSVAAKKAAPGKSKEKAAKSDDSATKEEPVKAAVSPVTPTAPPPPVDYNFQVRPLLAGTCFKCHGRDEKDRKGKLRLDIAEAAYAKAIKPGDPDNSEFVKRLFTTVEDDVMPPSDSGHPLQPEDRELLRRWVAEGAKYDTHWSFKPLVKPEIPATTKNDPWVRQEIDAFVLAPLKERKIKPADSATRERWIRRVTMDLTGLPPTLEEIDGFLRDNSESPYNTVVERLLASPHYGERMALDWLDAARYADTFGRHEDPDSENFPYRDWAIQVFNQNLPYDKFVEWQIAGDMIPNATVQTTLATAFNRMHQQSNEAGSDEEEFRCEHVADRTKTTAEAFLGLTMECARCHDHKYDPITTKEYYSFGAFLNNIDEMGLAPRFTTAVPTPNMFLYAGDEEAKHKELKAKVELKEAEIQALEPSARQRFAAWLAAGNKPVASNPIDHIPFEGKLRAQTGLPNVATPERVCEFKFKPDQIDGIVGKALFLKGDVKMAIPATGDFRRHEPFSLSIMLRPHEHQSRATVMHHTAGSIDAASRGYELLLDEMRPDFCLAHFWPGDGIRIRAKNPLPLNEWSYLTATYDGSSKAAGTHLYRNGIEIPCDVIGDHLTMDIRYDADSGDLDSTKVADAGLSTDLPVEVGGRRNDAGLINADIDEIKVFDRGLSSAEVKEMAGVKTSKEDWFAWYEREIDPPLLALNKELFKARLEENDFSKKLRQMMIMKEHAGPRRKTWILTRGAFNAHGEEVQPDVPKSIFPWPEELPRDRIGLAKWFTDTRNPLTARVAVNRYWQIFFGKGIVGTPEDFGIQGALPSNPLLLDWLACDFREHGWDIKRLCRMITLSATYRQSSRPADLNLLKEDPENRLLARGPHHRWNAEFIRDEALAVSGLLVPTIGGESVKPYQPAGLWEDSGTQHVYVQDTGEKLYRRSMYSFWRRTMPPPTMTIFDAPTREYCVVRRERTSSPMQALALMNDPQGLENARILAEKMMKAHPGDLKAQVLDSFRLCTSRKPSDAEMATLTKFYKEMLARYQEKPEDATALLEKNGEHPTDTSLPAPELAALTLVQRTLFNSPEAISKY